MARDNIIKHSPADRRGLGMVFLGMQELSGAQISTDTTVLMQMDEFLLSQIEALIVRIEHLELPWWKRLWMWIKGE